MEIILGKTAGFCYGVKRAVDGAKEQLKEKGKKVYCLGEIVHNERVIKELEQKGLTFIHDINEADSETIIRAHGVSKKVYEQSKEKNIKIKDYTCPNVLKIHDIAEEYANKGYYIFLFGSKKHPENLGTISYCGKNSEIIENETQLYCSLENFKKSGIKKLLVISQTTYSLEKFYILEEIINNELDKSVEIIIKNTICRATELRQKETDKISKEVDYMIIVGGKNSSNTQKLFNIAKKNCNSCICVETFNELNIEEIKKFEKVGIMAGASTPKNSIQEIIEVLKID